MSEGDPASLHWDPGALLQTGLVEAHRSWQGTGMKEGGEKLGVLVWEVPPLPTSSHMAVPPPLVFTARPHLKLPLPASRAQGRDVAGTCDLVLPKLVVFVRLLQGLDGRVVDLSKPLQHHWGQRRVKG